MWEHSSTPSEYAPKSCSRIWASQPQSRPWSDECHSQRGDHSQEATNLCKARAVLLTATIIVGLHLLAWPRASNFLKISIQNPTCLQIDTKSSNGSSESSKRGSLVFASNTIALRIWWETNATPGEGNHTYHLEKNLGSVRPKSFFHNSRKCCGS